MVYKKCDNCSKLHVLTACPDCGCWSFSIVVVIKKH